MCGCRTFLLGIHTITSSYVKEIRMRQTVDNIYTWKHSVIYARTPIPRTRTAHDYITHLRLELDRDLVLVPQPGVYVDPGGSHTRSHRAPPGSQDRDAREEKHVDGQVSGQRRFIRHGQVQDGRYGGCDDRIDHQVARRQPVHDALLRHSASPTRGRGTGTYSKVDVLL